MSHKLQNLLQRAAAGQPMPSTIEKTASAVFDEALADDGVVDNELAQYTDEELAQMLLGSTKTASDTAEEPEAAQAGSFTPEQIEAAIDQGCGQIAAHAMVQELGLAKAAMLKKVCRVCKSAKAAVGRSTCAGCSS